MHYLGCKSFEEFLDKVKNGLFDKDSPQLWNFYTHIAKMGYQFGIEESQNIKSNEEALALIEKATEHLRNNKL